MGTLELSINRFFKGDDYTIGRLSVDGVILCDTMEDPVRLLVDNNCDGDYDDAGEGKIKGRTAIPAGKYRVVLRHSPRFKRITPHITGVPGFKYILIHAGNTAADTVGCILPGLNNIKGRVLMSRHYEYKITAIITDAVEAGKDVYISIQ